jgi:alkylhydroperoxidase family enzyme
LAKQLGVAEQLLDAMYHIDQHAEEFTPAERAALRFAELMTTDAREVSEEVWEALQEHFDDGEITELAAVIGLFNYLNRFNTALDVELAPLMKMPDVR